MVAQGPRPLADHHRLDAFRCADAGLARWLSQRARRNQREGASRTFVICEGDDVIGFYCLSAGSVTRAASPGRVRRNMPEPIPVIVLGRLAVHADWSGRGLGRALLKDAVVRSAAVAAEIGVRALLCHAVSPEARAFYLHHGFTESPVHPLTLLLPIQ